VKVPPRLPPPGPSSSTEPETGNGSPTWYIGTGAGDRPESVDRALIVHDTIHYLILDSEGDDNVIDGAGVRNLFHRSSAVSPTIAGRRGQRAIAYDGDVDSTAGSQEECAGRLIATARTLCDLNRQCRASNKNRGDILLNPNASRSDWVELLVVARNDLEALLYLLLSKPTHLDRTRNVF